MVCSYSRRLPAARIDFFGKIVEGLMYRDDGRFCSRFLSFMEMEGDALQSGHSVCPDVLSLPSRTSASRYLRSDEGRASVGKIFASGTRRGNSGRSRISFPAPDGDKLRKRTKKKIF